MKGVQKCYSTKNRRASVLLVIACICSCKDVGISGQARKGQKVFRAWSGQVVDQRPIQKLCFTKLNTVRKKLAVMIRLQCNSINTIWLQL